MQTIVNALARSQIIDRFHTSNDDEWVYIANVIDNHVKLDEDLPKDQNNWIVRYIEDLYRENEKLRKINKFARHATYCSRYILGPEHDCNCGYGFVEGLE